MYWIPLFGVLDGDLHPRRLKSVPGRKTDVLDCQWLHNCTPTVCCPFIRVLRSYLRQRAMLVEYAAHHDWQT